MGGSPPHSVTSGSAGVASRSFARSSRPGREEQHGGGSLRAVFSPPPWSCGGRLSFRPNRFPLELGRDMVTVLERVIIYGNQNIATMGGNSKTFQVSPTGEAWRSTALRGCFSYHPPALLRALRPSVRLLFRDLAVGQNSVALACSHAFPISGAGFWCGRGASSPHDSYSSHNSEG